MEQNIKITPAYQRTVLTPSMRRDFNEEITVIYGGDLEVVEVAEELNDAAKLKESSTFDTDIPYNTNNRWIVDKYGNNIPILVNAHGMQLPDRAMRVNGYSESAGQYDVSFVRSQDWPEILKNISLNEIDGFDPFQLSEAFIDDNQINDAAYPGPGPTPTRGFYTPLAYYGGLQRFNEATSTFELVYSDYRLWFHYAKVLAELFCVAGYRMDCPLLETEYGQRMGGYLATDGKVYDGFAAHFIGPGAILQETPFARRLQLPASKHYSFYVQKTSAQVITGTQDPQWLDSELVTFQDDTTAPFYDNGAAVSEGFYNTVTETINGFSGKWRYEIRLRISGGASPILALFGIVLNDISGPVNNLQTIFFDAGGEVLGYDLLTITVPGGNVTVDMMFYVTVESVLNFRDIAPAFLFGDGIGLTIEAGSTIKGTGEFIIATNNPTEYISIGSADTINRTVVFPQSWLSSKIKGIELLESYCHRTNSKIYTDRARRIVGIYTEHDILTYGEATEPYYFDTIEQDMSEMQVKDSATVNLKDVVAPAKYILGFKDSTDAYVESVSKSQPYEAVIDMTGFAENIDTKKTFENRDNLTEPTLERPFVEIRTQNPKDIPPSVMAVLDNLVGEVSATIAPRTAYFYGIVRQKIGSGSDVKQFRKRWGGVTFTASIFAYATQYPSGELTDAGSVDIDNDKTIVYDHTEAVSEPMKRYWIDTIRVIYLRQTRKLTVLVGSFNRFTQINFRHLYRFKFMGIDWKGRITLKRTKVNDFRQVEVEVVEEKVC